jgi:hypothetical protein
MADLNQPIGMCGTTPKAEELGKQQGERERERERERETTTANIRTT